MITVLFGLSFTCVQAYEYAHAPFTFGFNHLALVPFTDAAHASLASGAGNLQAPPGGGLTRTGPIGTEGSPRVSVVIG